MHCNFSSTYLYSCGFHDKSALIRVMPWYPSHNKPALPHNIAWCRQIISHYLKNDLHENILNCVIMFIDLLRLNFNWSLCFQMSSKEWWPFFSVLQCVNGWTHSCIGVDINVMVSSTDRALLKPEFVLLYICNALKWCNQHAETCLVAHNIGNTDTNAFTMILHKALIYKKTCIQSIISIFMLAFPRQI